MRSGDTYVTLAYWDYKKEKRGRFDEIVKLSTLFAWDGVVGARLPITV